MSTLHFLPEFKTSAELRDTLRRIEWYFGPFVGQISSIVFYAPDDLEMVEIDGPLRGKVKIAPAPWPKEFGGSDAVLVWNLGRISKDDLASAQRLRSVGRYYEVDPVRTRMEGSFYLWAGHNLFADKGAILARSKARLKRFQQEKVSLPKAYVFGTGPSLSDFCTHHDFSDGHCIAANSMVKNKDMMRQLKPVAIAAGDPLFHAGVSSYAAEFRKSLVEAMQETGAYFFTPIRDYHVYEAFLDEALIERVIAVPFERGKGFNPNLGSSFWVAPYANVLTLLLLPLASTIAKEIAVVGCDGRPLEQDDYFWKHDTKAQFNDKMDDVKKTHPAFFSIDYNDYYLQHCGDVGSAIDRIEATGRKVTCLTPSYVPALHEREQSSSLEKLIIIDQDAIDDFGHFLSYDVRLAEAAHAAGCAEVSVVGNFLFNPADFPREIDRFEPWFSVHSWASNRPDAICAPEDRRQFEEDLNFMVPRILNSDTNASFTIYCYCGAFEQAEAIAAFLDSHPGVTANVNLFWIYKVDETSGRFLKRWRAFLQQADEHPRLQLTVMTERQSDDLAHVTDVRLPVAPHPSTTFSDATVADMLSRRPHVASDPFRVLFPGGMLVEKGFGLTVDTVQKLSGVSGFDLYVRALEVQNTPPAMKRAKAKLGGPNVYLYPDHMSDEQFAFMLDQADLIVCPYLAPDFSRRTSGLVIDALLLGRPVVVTSGTWLEEIVMKYGFGVVAKPTAKGLARAIREAKRRYSKLSDNAHAARRGYLKKDSWDRLYGSIIGPKTGPLEGVV